MYHVKSCGNIDSRKTLAIDMQNTAWHHTYACKNEGTSQNTMYCGGEPEHKRIAKKYMHITMMSYIELHTQNKCMCHESSSLAVRLFTNHRC